MCSTSEATATRMLSGFFFWSFSSTGWIAPEKSSVFKDFNSVLKLANLYGSSQPPFAAKASRTYTATRRGLIASVNQHASFGKVLSLGSQARYNYVVTAVHRTGSAP